MTLSGVAKFLKLKWQLRCLLLATLAIAVYSYILFAFFKSNARFNSKRKASVTKKSLEEELKIVTDIRWCIQVVSNVVFWKNVCRHQAFQAALLLNYYKIPYRVFVGFKKNNNELSGHAWTVACGQMVTGFCNPDDYVVLTEHS